MDFKKPLRKITVFKPLAIAFTAAALLCLLSLSIFAETTDINVTQESDITDALETANKGDTLTFIFGNHISLKSSSAASKKIIIPENVTAVFTNAADRDVTVRRSYSTDLDDIPFSPMVTVKGTMILKNSSGGSIEFESGGYYFGDESMFNIVENGSFIMSSGTISGCYGNNGPVVKGLEGTSIEISGGRLCLNIAKNSGGAIYTSGKLKISGGSFDTNAAKDSGGVIYASGDVEITGGSFTENSSSNGGSVL